MKDIFPCTICQTRSNNICYQPVLALKTMKNSCNRENIIGTRKQTMCSPACNSIRLQLTLRLTDTSFLMVSRFKEEVGYFSFPQSSVSLPFLWIRTYLHL